MCNNVGGATEYQGDGTPHFHGFLDLIHAYKDRTLQEIADMIRSKCMHVREVKAYVQHICREEHYDHEQHQRKVSEYEEAWKHNYSGREHIGLSVRPRCLFGTAGVPSLWESAVEKRVDVGAIFAEAAMYNKRFETDAQNIFLRY